MNSSINNCEPCATVPSTTAPAPPICPTVPVVCAEYVESSCVVSSTTASCQAVYTNPTTGATTNVGLTITDGQTTLTDVYAQLTSTACIFNPTVIGAVLQIIGNPAYPDLNQLFCDIVCACTCDDSCVNVIPVTQAVFTDVTEDSFDINFLAQPNYTYQITINDNSAIPFTYYTWASTNAPNTGTAPALFTVNTSAFNKYINNVPVNPPILLDPSHIYSIYINAQSDDGGECPGGPWSVTTLPSASCPAECAQIQLNVGADPGATSNFAFIVTFLQGPSFPTAYRANIYDSSNNNVIPLNTQLIIGNVPDPDPITGLYPTTSTTYDWPAIVATDDYKVLVTPICSTTPLLCLGTEEEVTIPFAGPAVCSIPDITSVTVTSS